MADPQTSARTPTADDRAPSQRPRWQAMAAKLMGRALRAMATALAVGSRWLVRAAWRHRGALTMLVTRVAWWGALVLWWTTAMPLAGTDAVDLAAATRTFAVGAIVCAVIVATAGLFRELRHLQWAGGVLGSLHGVCGVVLWSIAGA